MRWLVLLVAAVVLSVASAHLVDALGGPPAVRALVSGVVLGLGVYLAARDLRDAGP